mmetsp:Transcript_6082/g.13779  ORF Transcript_6082/g.13779 Transcript_6082/m.13779 type:complete len:423 (-) Transcript_6082:149-1417(-)|eukprot:CAMPEP_0172325920 /NCGR_PEP_ID=MMETSP1058-20130122/55045_1 /TAXON_ID=83371 /ORGANISM="Detonula confervacea, Strain CCMP 353" /LENGTH=422 /DNA_ID=CAMNT_0013042557 /DNA_START=14 /DNA_END=1282 /DNA_ORIENTATION=+
MRVLCLHSAASSALQFSQEFHKLEERLWEKYEIELVFVDGPLLDVQVGNAVGDEGGGINAIDNPNRGSSGSSGSSDERVSRRWYVEESARKEALPPTTTTAAATSSSVQYSGLDASLLHLSQIWTRGGANISNNLGECLPFQGVMGVGQGADVAGLLPLLNYQEEDGGGGGDSSDEDEKENNAHDRLTNRPTMFQGLQFVILIDGNDILFRREGSGNDDDDNVNKEELENDVYVGPDGVQSLHVMMEKNDNANDNARSSSSEQLANKYGPNATIHHCKQSNNTCTPALSNIIGKFLITQKNKLHSNPKSLELLSLQNQLANVEQMATLAISQEIQRNPPKALMAVIGPAAMLPNAGTTKEDDEAMNDGEDGEKHHHGNQGGKESVKVDKAVGAWQGARRRGFGEEGGGAPCPGDFLLREEER